MKAFKVRRSLAVSSALALFLLSLVSSARAEEGSRLRGTIVTASKVAMVGATVTLKGATNSFISITDARGEYIFPNVPPGVYQFSVKQTNYAPIEIDAVTLDLDQVRVLNATMAESAAAAEAEGATQGRVGVVPQETFLRGLVDPQRMSELPLNGRNFADLIYTQAGVARTPIAIQTGIYQLPANSLGSGQSVQGARSTYNYFLLDGNDLNDPEYVAGASTSVNTGGVPLDAIDEFSVLTTNAGAEYGHVSGATVNIVTKSGTDQLHGSLWEFLRNNVLDSRDYFDAPNKKQPFRQNQFGGRLGGGIAKTYFSVAYEGFRQRQQVALNAFVPTPGFLAAIPNPLWKALLQTTYPAPNQPFDPTSAVGTFNTAYDNGNDQDAGFVRMDRNLGQAHRDNVVLNVVDGNKSPRTDGIQGTGLGQTQRSWNGGFTDNWTLRSTLYNMFHVSFNRTSNASFTDQPAPGVLQTGRFRFAGPYAGLPFDPSSASPNGFPYIVFTTSIFSPIGSPYFVPQNRATNALRVQDSVAWIKSKHQFTFGVDAGRTQINNNLGLFARPFTVIESSSPINLLVGVVAFQQQNSYLFNNTAMRGYRSSDVNLFAADSYRIHPRLSIDYGLRYELNLPVSEVQGAITNPFVMQNGKPLPCQTLPAGTGWNNVASIHPSKFGIGTYCTDRMDIAPRVGFSWDAFGHGGTVLRGAYGIFYDRVYGVLLQSSRSNPPEVVSTALSGFLLDGRQGSSIVNPTDALALGAVDPALKTPRVQRWHLTLSQELTPDVVVNASYVGAHGARLIRTDFPNFGTTFADGFRPSNGSTSVARDPQDVANGILKAPFGSVALTRSDSSSNYNALQLEVLKRYSRGLTLQATYTWSHSLDTGSGEVIPGPATTTNNLLAPLFVPGSSCSGAASGVRTAAAMTAAVRCATGNASLTTDQAAAIFVKQFVSTATAMSNYASSDFDVRHRLTMNAIYELPIGKSKLALNNLNGFADKLISGWQVASTLEHQSGVPVPILAGVDANFDGTNNDSAVLTGNLSQLSTFGGSVAKDPSGVARQLSCTVSSNTCVSPVGQGFGVIDAQQRLRNGAVRAPGLLNVDLSLNKTTKIRDKYSLQFRSEFFNVFNHVNFAGPISAINNPTFGITSGQLLINNTQSRQIQFGLKLQF